MTVLNLQEAFSHLDDELIDNYLTCRTRNRARLARRQVMRKRVLTCAACFMLVAAVTLAVAYHIRYPAIPLENAVGNVSARYVPGWMVEGKNFPTKKDYTDYELFNRSDCVFSGTIEKIDHVKIDFDGQIIYRSIITITTDHFYILCRSFQRFVLPGAPGGDHCRAQAAGFGDSGNFHGHTGDV